jgi:hypothetical protein
MKTLHRFGITFVTVLALMSMASAQKWQTLKNPATFFSDTSLLLTDGTVIVHEYCTPNWHRLTPDQTGSYLNGTWSKIHSMMSYYASLYFVSSVA